MPRNSSGRMGKLLLILALLGGAGTWNYTQNLRAENAEPRPYRGLSQDALVALEVALQAEIEGLAERYQAATGRTLSISDAGQLDEKVREFERVQSISQDTRVIGQQLSKSEGSLGRVRNELRRREEERNALQLHLRRLLSFRA